MFICLCVRDSCWLESFLLPASTCPAWLLPTCFWIARLCKPSGGLLGGGRCAGVCARMCWHGGSASVAGVVERYGRVHGANHAVTLPLRGQAMRTFCLVGLIDYSWEQLSMGPVFYPGLTEVSDTTCVWRVCASDTSAKDAMMIRAAGIPFETEWLGWHDISLDTCELADDLLEVWRRQNPEFAEVARVTTLLKEGAYDVRLYPYDPISDRQPILFISWAIHDDCSSHCGFPVRNYVPRSHDACCLFPSGQCAGLHVAPRIATGRNVCHQGGPGS